MARFYGSVRGKARTEAAREGTERSGIRGHIRGWDAGIEVNGQAWIGPDAPPGSDYEWDRFHVTMTGGSAGDRQRRTFATLDCGPNGERILTILDPVTEKTLAVFDGRKAGNLMAAAPKLLAAAKNARNVLAGLATGDLRIIERDSPALAELREAIAEAEGGAP